MTVHDASGRPVPRQGFSGPSAERLEWARRYAACAEEVVGGRLVSVALYGSVARGDAHERSDVDLLLVADGLPQGRLARADLLDAIEARLAPRAPAAPIPALQAQALTPEEARRLRPIYFDLSEDAVLLFDRDGFLAAVLQGVRQRLKALGAVRRRLGRVQYWDLKPALRPGERFDL